MYNHYKYIVVDSMGHEFMIVFPPTLSHSNVTLGFGNMVISAGFISDHYQCYGESDSTGYKSRDEEDTQIFIESYGKLIGK